MFCVDSEKHAEILMIQKKAHTAIKKYNSLLLKNLAVKVKHTYNQDVFGFILQIIINFSG